MSARERCEASPHEIDVLALQVTAGNLNGLVCMCEALSMYASAGYTIPDDAMNLLSYMVAEARNGVLRQVGDPDAPSAREAAT